MKRRMRIAILFLSVVLVLFAVRSYAMSDRPDKSAGANPQETQELAKATIDKMIALYSKGNAEDFMESVADDFRGDKTLLDMAVRKDSSLYTDIDIRYTLDNVVSNSAGDMVSVTINFTRSHKVIQTTVRGTESGTTELIFKRAGEIFKLYSMKPPLVFGISGL